MQSNMDPLSANSISLVTYCTTPTISVELSISPALHCTTSTTSAEPSISLGPSCTCYSQSPYLMPPKSRLAFVTLLQCCQAHPTRMKRHTVSSDTWVSFFAMLHALMSFSFVFSTALEKSSAMSASKS